MLGIGLDEHNKKGILVWKIVRKASKLYWMTFAHLSSCFIYFMSLANRGASLVNETAERWLWLLASDDAPYILLCSLLNGSVLLPASDHIFG